MKFLISLGGVLAALAVVWLCIDAAQQGGTVAVAPYDVLWWRLVGALPFHPAWLLVPVGAMAIASLEPHGRQRVR